MKESALTNLFAWITVVVCVHSFIHSFIHLFHIPSILYRCETSHLYI